jgi:hypothetical protein
LNENIVIKYLRLTTRIHQLINIHEPAKAFGRESVRKLIDFKKSVERWMHWHDQI